MISQAGALEKLEKPADAMKSVRSKMHVPSPPQILLKFKAPSECCKKVSVAFSQI